MCNYLLQEHSIKSDTVWDMENEFKHVKQLITLVESVCFLFLSSRDVCKADLFLSFGIVISYVFQ